MDRQPQSESILSALIAFGVLAVLGPWLEWSTGDLLWGLLLTSLATCVIGASAGGASLWLRGWQKLPPDVWKRLGYVIQTPFLALFVLVIVAVCYLFHALYGFVIYFLFPLWPETPSTFDLDAGRQERMLLEAAHRYWPFVAVTLATGWRDLLRPLFDPQPLDIVRPWALLLRMHLFIFIAIATVIAAGTGYVFYLLILLFFLFPWRLLYRQSSGNY